VVLFPGCLIEFVYPHIGEKIISLLNRNGKKVLFPENLNCCAYPLIASGDWKTANEIAVNNIEILNKQNCPIITACPTCLEALSERYPEIMEKDNALYGEALKIAGRCTDISNYLLNVLGCHIKTESGEKITYHTPCHLKKNKKMADSPTEILRKSRGNSFIEMKNSAYCCGAGGSFAVEYPPLSGAISKRKTDSIEKTGAETVVTSCPGCLMQIEGTLQKLKKTIKAKHIVEIL